MSLTSQVAPDEVERAGLSVKRALAWKPGNPAGAEEEAKEQGRRGRVSLGVQARQREARGGRESSRWVPKRERVFR